MVFTWRSSWPYRSNLGLHVREGIWRGPLLPSLRLLQLVDEGFQVRLRTRRTRPARGARHAGPAGGADAALPPALAGPPGRAPLARGALHVDLLARPLALRLVVVLFLEKERKDINWNGTASQNCICQIFEQNVPALCTYVRT